MRVKLSVLVLLTLLMLSSPGYIYASDLNGVDTTTATEVTSEPEATESTETESGVTSDQHLQDQENNANAVADMFGNVGPKAEDFAKAQEFIRPFAKIMNYAMAVILGITALAMMFITVLDLLYMAFPPVRDLLDGGMNGQQQGTRGQRGPRGMQGQRGMGMMPGMGMESDSSMGLGSNQGVQQQQSAPGGGFSALGRWVSDEALAACMETKGGIMPGQTVLPIKLMIFSYLKKRSLFLFLFGVCVVLFTSTVFTDLGIKLGMLILGKLSGF